MSDPSGVLTPEYLRAFWCRHGRLVLLVAAFAVPIFVNTPLFVLPLGDQIPFSSPVGVCFQILQRMPSLITSIAMLVWLAWRKEWEPSESRAELMFVALFAGIVLLPLFCSILNTFTILYSTGTWRVAIAETWRWWGPPQIYFDLIRVVMQAAIVLVALRVADRVSPRSIIEPGRAWQSPPRLNLTIRWTAGVTISVAVVLFATRWLVGRFQDAEPTLTFDSVAIWLVSQVWGMLSIAIIVCLVARISHHSFDVLVPALAMVCGVHLGLMYTDSQILGLFPDGYVLPGEFSLLDRLPVAISLVLSAQVVFWLFRSIGLPIQYRSLKGSGGEDREDDACVEAV
ncbi:hypothetical protein [Aporhodopirellula aestuarii]|uniref:Uncharacterized protein n=1 Tax=Aporhodopirellula aestuarii TaxID=2950107 RepID=A0ABT0UBS2_9BACT|nr:hypothetical protein [Aporhodopirellula aestuarii]MCM2374267.1 hypothetical protein [Aporhodopirellula aestuarii]